MGQHRVSEFYLRGFSQRHGPRILFEYDKKNGFTQEIKPKFASAGNKIFAVEGPNEDAVEQFLGLVETKAKPVLDKARNQLPLDQKDRVALSQFMSLSYVRSPRISEHYDYIRGLFTIDGMAEWLRGPKAKIDWMMQNPTKRASEYDRDVAVFIQSVQDGGENPPAKPPINSQFSLLEFQPSQIATLLGMSWTIEIAGDGAFYIVGDEPFCVRRPGHLFNQRYVPVADKNAEVSFPLNRRMCLTARWSNKAESPNYIFVARNRVDELNLRTVMCAHRFFWSSVRTAYCDEYIRHVEGQSISVSAPKTLVEFFDNPKLL